MTSWHFLSIIIRSRQLARKRELSNTKGLDFHPSIAIQLSNLGQVEKSLGNLIDARQYTQRAIEIGEVNTPHDLKRLITRYNNLANIEYLLGNTKAAKDNEAKAQKLLNALQRDQL